MIKIDLHVHAAEHSPCASALEEEQIIAAIDRGLDALVFTNHESLVPLERLAELNQMFAPFRIFGGVEITLLEGEDILVLGVRHPELEIRAHWTYPDLHTLVRAHQGWMAVAHPFRFAPNIRIDLERYPPDALEVCSSNTPLRAQPCIRDIAATLGIPTICNSDAHKTQTLGVAYNRLRGDPADEQELLELLRRGEFLCVCGLT